MKEAVCLFIGLFWMTAGIAAADDVPASPAANVAVSAQPPLQDQREDSVAGPAAAPAAPSAGETARPAAGFSTLRLGPGQDMSTEDFPGLVKRISIDVRGMSIVDFMKFLAVEGNINIAIAPDVAGAVNLLVNDVTINDILRIVLSTNNLAYQVQGNVLKIISNNEYKTRQGTDFNDQRRTVIFQL
ncbi:MAG: secretin and TonB N-terminal domain-containing protein [Candidatus Omnitrophica bacterium]|nr:secretin and TonB N-terminal domain-containing protein [Candidatus Omnitrophota bacterium]